MKLLNDYIPFSSALKFIGAPSTQNMRLYRIIEKHDIESRRVGGMRFVEKDKFYKYLDAQNISHPKKVWPLYLAIVPFKDLMSAKDVAEVMNLTPRHVYNLGEEWRIEYYDMSPWGGHRLYSRASVRQEQNRRAWKKEALRRKRTPRSATWKKENHR